MTQQADPPATVRHNPPKHGKPKKGEPAWGLAALYPLQGYWTEEEYLALEGNLLVEFTDGFIEVLPMPTILHQRILVFLFDLLRPAADAINIGEVLFAPLRTKFRVGKWREPDLIVFDPEQSTPDGKYPTGAKLVVEVVSPDDRSQQRDYVEKRADYAKAGVAEYWLVDPQALTILVLRLEGNAYAEHGTFRPGGVADSVLIPAFKVDVAALFAAGKRKAKATA